MEGGMGFPFGGDPDDLMRGLREFAERQTEAMQESQREQFATLTLNTAAAGPETITIDATQVSRTGSQTITYAGGTGIETLTVNGSAAADTINVTATAAAVAVTVDGLGAGDAYTVTQSAVGAAGLSISDTGGAGTDSLTPIAPLGERIEAWKEVSGKTIESYVGDIAEGTQLYRSPGELVFRISGHEYRLAVSADSGSRDYFIMLWDSTATTTTSACSARRAQSP